MNDIRPYDENKMTYLLKGGKHSISQKYHAERERLKAEGGRATESEVLKATFDVMCQEPGWVALWNKNSDRADAAYKHEPANPPGN